MEYNGTEINVVLNLYVHVFDFCIEFLLVVGEVSGSIG